MREEGPSECDRPQMDSMNGQPTGLGRAVAVGLGLALTAILVSTWDFELSDMAVNRRWPSDLKRVIDLSEVMAHGLTVAIILGLVYRLAPHRRDVFWWLVACPIAAGLSVNLIKAAVLRWRPYRFWEMAGTGADPEERTFVEWLPILESGYLRESFRQSFPSGHTAPAMGLAFALCWAFPQGRVFFVTLAIMAGLQRVVSHSHWPSDVLAGGAIGWLTAALIQAIHHRQAVRVSETS